MINFQKTYFLKIISIFLVVLFISQNNLVSGVSAQGEGESFLPRLVTSEILLQGMTIYPDPFKFDFIVNPGEARLPEARFNQESEKLIKYFLAALTTPDDEMWVNLAPQEKNRIIAPDFEKTDMGQDMLAQDYLLKQLSATLMDPQSNVGAELWEKIYQAVNGNNNGADLSMDLLNRIWIMPDEVKVVVRGNSVFVAEAKLKVMLEQDYFSSVGPRHVVADITEQQTALRPQHAVALQIIKEIIIPVIEKEVNEGKTFAPLRQIFSSLILATWYKRNLQKTLLARSYVDKHKTNGIEQQDPQAAEKIFNQYFKSFSDASRSYIKEEYDPPTQSIIPKKYFSGGVNAKIGKMGQGNFDKALMGALKDSRTVQVTFAPVADRAMLSLETVKRILGNPDQLKEGELSTIYQTLKQYKYGASRAIYYVLYKKTKMDIYEAIDLVEAARIGAVEFILAYQKWEETIGKDPNVKMVIEFATGKSPEMTYQFITEFINNWSEEHLQKYGIDISRNRPDMKRVISFHLDTVMPQKRGAYFAFPNLVKKWNTKLGIPEAQRNFFFGDVIYDETAPVGFRQMTDQEFDELIKNVEQNGLLVKDFNGSYLNEKNYPLQYLFFKGMEKQNRYMTQKLMELGGPDVVFGSTGPSYEGLGHVAFVESENVDKMEAFMDLANHHNVAGQSEQSGGYQARIGKMGFATFSLRDITQKPTTKFIMIVLDEKKKQSVRLGVEGDFNNANDRRVPIVHLQKSGGVFITDIGSSTELLINKYPWDFQLFEKGDWNLEMQKKFIVRLSQRLNKPIKDLTEDDFLNFEQEKTHPLLLWLRKKNLESLRETGLDFNSLKAKIFKEVRDQIILSKGLAVYLWGEEYVTKFVAIKKEYDDARELYFFNKKNQEYRERFKKAEEIFEENRKNMFGLQPHLDDHFLADPAGYKELIRQGHRFITLPMTPGSSSVADSYVLKMLQHMLIWDEEQFLQTKALDQKAMSIKLMEMALTKQVDSEVDLVKYDSWERMSSDEQDIRSKLLFNLMDKLTYRGNEIETLSDARKKINGIIKFITEKPAWGSASTEELDQIKEFIRFTEERTAMLSWGSEFEDILEPIKPSWYSSTGKLGTATKEDIQHLIDKLRQYRRIDVVFGNGEGFADYNAHSSTEATVIVALMELKKLGELDSETFRYVTYAGVWERNSVENSNLTIVYSESEIEDFLHAFWTLYACQAPAQVPDASYRELNLFSEAVRRNGIKTRDELLQLLQDGSPESQSLQKLLGSALALNFRVVNIFDPKTQDSLKHKIYELERVRGDLGRMTVKAFYGDLPKPDVASDAAIAAQADSRELGGIDFNPQKWQMKEGGSQSFVENDKAMFADDLFDLQGLRPVIVSVKATDIVQLLK